MDPHRLRLLALYLSAWLVLGALLVYALLRPEPGTALPTAVFSALLAAAFAALSLAARFPVRSVALEWAKAPQLLVTHLGGAVLTSSVWLGLAQLLLPLVGRLPGGAAMPALLEGNRALLALVGALLYLVSVLLQTLLLAFEEGRGERTRRLALEVATREAELAALKAQVDPHFLFNSLNSLASLCGSDARSARAMAISLAELFRATLRLARQRATPLGEELALLANYLEVEKVRFGSRLRWHFEVEEEARAVPVPPLVLQPLVENAVRHGIGLRPEGGEIHLRAWLHADQLGVTIENDLAAEAPTRTRGTGLGLELVGDRLRLTYPGRARIEVGRPPGRFRVELTLPREGP